MHINSLQQILHTIIIACSLIEQLSVVSASLCSNFFIYIIYIVYLKLMIMEKELNTMDLSLSLSLSLPP